MASSQPPVAVPPINVPGLSCTGIVSGSEVNYQCHTIPAESVSFTRYEFEHLLKPHFWILAVLILYTTGKTSEHAYRSFLRTIAGFSLERPQPRSRAMQSAALLVYSGILWLVWFEEYMVLSTEWRVARKVIAVWRPSLTPLRLLLLVLYPVWMIIIVLCFALVAFTIAVGVGVTKVQMGRVKEMALIVIGRKGLDPRVLEEYDACLDEKQKVEKMVNEI